MSNNKSDVEAKEIFKSYLNSLNYYDTVEIKKSPSDIIASKNGEYFYFEIKMTKSEKDIFGASTITEWEQAIKTPENYKFVLVDFGKGEIPNLTPITYKNIKFYEFSPSEFMEYSSVPPFKIFFNIKRKPKKRKSEKKQMTMIKMDILKESWIRLKKSLDKPNQ